MSKSQLRRVGTQGQKRIERLLQWLHEANLVASCPPNPAYRRRLIEFTVIDECDAGGKYAKEPLEANMSDINLMITALSALLDASKS